MSHHAWTQAAPPNFDDDDNDPPDFDDVSTHSALSIIIFVVDKLHIWPKISSGLLRWLRFYTQRSTLGVLHVKLCLGSRFLLSLQAGDDNIQGMGMNPYEHVITLFGQILESFDDDNIIPTYGYAWLQSYRPCRLYWCPPLFISPVLATSVRKTNPFFRCTIPKPRDSRASNRSSYPLLEQSVLPLPSFTCARIVPTLVLIRTTTLLLSINRWLRLTTVSFPRSSFRAPQVSRHS